MEQADRIALHRRESEPRITSFWSRDDTKFLLAAPFLLGAAVLFSPERWQQCARFIESIAARVDRGHEMSPATAIVAQRLGVSEGQLGKIVAQSRVNRTEHLIHVLHSLLRRHWRPCLDIVGRQHLDGALAQGQGAVLWVAHFSFASLFAKMALCDAGYGVSHISRPEHGVSKSRFGIRYLNGFRSAAENRHLRRRIVHRRQHPDATREAALVALRRNELLSITAGAWEGRHLATGELLGARYTVSTGAPALAFQGGARLLPVLTTRNDESGAYQIAVGAPLGELRRSALEDFVLASTAEFYACYEDVIRKAPEQWRGWSTLLA